LTSALSISSISRSGSAAGSPRSVNQDSRITLVGFKVIVLFHLRLRSRRSPASHPLPYSAAILVPALAATGTRALQPFAHRPSSPTNSGFARFRRTAICQCNEEMTPLQHDPPTYVPWTRTMFGRGSMLVAASLRGQWSFLPCLPSGRWRGIRMLTAPAARDQVQSGCRYRSPGVAAHGGIDICRNAYHCKASCRLSRRHLRTNPPKLKEERWNRPLTATTPSTTASGRCTDWRVSQLGRVGIAGPLAEIYAGPHRLASDRPAGAARLPRGSPSARLLTLVARTQHDDRSSEPA